VGYSWPIVVINEKPDLAATADALTSPHPGVEGSTQQVWNDLVRFAMYDSQLYNGKNVDRGATYSDLALANAGGGFETQAPGSQNVGDGFTMVTPAFGHRISVDVTEGSITPQDTNRPVWWNWMSS
jgi:hypothetical protein